MDFINCYNIKDFFSQIDGYDTDTLLEKLYIEDKFKELEKKGNWLELFKFKIRKSFKAKKHFSKIKKNKFMVGNSLFDYANDVIKNRVNYIELYNLLSDEESKNVLLNVLSYKITFNRDYLDINIRPMQDQYLDSEIMKFSENEVVADCGAYIGDNALTFFKYLKTANKYYAIEPDCKNLAIAKRILGKENFDNIEFFQLATGSENGYLNFTSSGAGGRINTEGENKVKIAKLDDIIKEPLTFIKMDIEGSEIDTLKGAVKQIKSNKPKLAICAYHKPDDLWKITKEVLTIRNDYKVYLRLYLSSFCETVLYFV